MTVSAELFRATLSRFASGVTVVTSRDPQGLPHGMTVSAFCSVSLDPPLVLVSIGKGNKSAGYIEALGWYGVSILAAPHEDRSRAFALGDPKESLFAEFGWKESPNGVPLLDGALATLECRVVQTIDAGDHLVFLGRVENASAHDGPPLLYFRAAYRTLAD